MTRREEPIQKAVVAYLRAVLPPECIVHHARGELNQRGERAMRELAKAKRLGAVAGFPDVVALTYRGALFFEVKAEGEYPRKNQRAVHDRLRAMGYRVAVVRSVEDVRETLREWSFPTRETGA